MFVPVMLASVLIVLMMNFFADEKRQLPALRKVFGNLFFQWFAVYVMIWLVFWMYYA
jgi:hypothetical protein